MVHLAQRGELPPLGEAAHHRAIELQDLDRLLFEQRAAAVARELALARRERDARLLREQLELAPVVGPAHRLLEPARPRAARAGARPRSRSARSQPRFTSTIRSLSLPITSRTSARRSMSSASGTPPALALKPVCPCALQHLHLVAQLGHVLAVAVIGAGHVARHFAAIAAEEPVQRQLRGLADDVPAGDVDRGGDAHQRFARPAFLVREPLPGQGEQLLVQPLRRERVGADDQLADAAAERVDRRFDRRVAGGDADALDRPRRSARARGSRSPWER